MANVRAKAQSTTTVGKTGNDADIDVDIDNDDDDVPTNPNALVDIEVHNIANAGKSPSSRWGVVKFDAEGYATIRLPLKDVHQLHHMGWLNEDDQQRYLGLEAAQPPSVNTQAIDAEMESLKGANIRLAMRNAELEAKNDYDSKQHAAEIETLKREHAEAIVALRAQIDAANAKAADKVNSELPSPQTDVKKDDVVKSERKGK